LEVLVIAGLIVLLALLFRVRADGRVAVAGLDDYPLPPVCVSYAWFGVKCPGCGLTRSVVYLAHGDLAASWQTHRLGWLFGVLILGQFPYRFLALKRGGRHPFGAGFPAAVGYLLLFLLFGNWLAASVADWLTR
jgi:hypothetical protein